MNFIHARPSALDLNLLKVFEAVFRERHLTRAADALSLTPSAVSHAMRRLRAHLGDPLFRREGHDMVPTPACDRLALPLLEQLEQLRRLLQQWARFDPAHTRQAFRIGMPEGVELALLPALQRVFFAAAPGASLASAPFERAHLGRLLAAGQIDAAIDVARPVRDPVRHLALDDDRFWVLTRRVGGPERAPTVKEYLAARHVVVSSRASGSVVEDEALLRQGAQREIALRCQNYATAMAVVASSDLWLTVPGRLSSAIEAPRDLRRWPLPMRMPRLAVHLYWHRHHDEDEASRWLRDLIERSVATQRATRQPG
jgi:DNA-binding transcriptional LysR family regulator